VFSIHAELQVLTAKLQAEEIPYALCGALALAVHGYPRATMDIDLLALAGSTEEILASARPLGFTLEASPMAFAAGKVQIRRLSKVIPGFEDVLMLDVLSLPAEIESAIPVEIVDWQGAFLRTVSREGLVRLKTLRGSAQDVADIEKLR
jgi:hypothetical protein